MSQASAFAGAIVVLTGTVVGALVALPPRSSGVVKLGAAGSPQSKSDAQRIDDLQRRLGDIAAEQKKLAKEVDEIAKQEAAQ